uniref:Sm domain-containing protein n=1 Tax=Pinguiococcus pyrenoidosus TaxID=172671 RepID=A0A7R9U2J8_9STRA|mmetsp:Transcript_10145/g.38490  ORF Transcript_10145/g.38490 Transcript_10145/m.38490 type:complete len:103 (+) Transcript_10145:131-439(+)
MSAMAAKKSILEEQLSKYIDQEVIVKFSGGREVRGVLKGYDLMANLVLAASVETLRDAEDPYRLTDETRSLGLTVCRGSQVSLIYPADGTEEIANPFLQQEA